MANASKASTPHVHWRIERFAIVDSTIEIALERMREDWNAGDRSTHGLVISAEQQRAGRPECVPATPP